jgi:hypothetical protein
MINKFIIPILVIIFSLLVIYYILDKKNKKYFIEKFIPLIIKNSNYQKIIINSEDNIENDINDDDDDNDDDDNNNYKYSKKILNESFVSKPVSTPTPLVKNSPNNELSYIIYSLKGTWTNNYSVVNNNRIYNTTTVDISDEKNPIVKFKFKNKKDKTYKVTGVKDNSIICKSNDDSNILYIRLLNDKEDNKIYKNTLVQYNGQKCLFSFYYPTSNKPFSRYISYQILKQPVDSNLLNIVKGKDWIVDFVKEPYDFKTYNIIVGKYKFPKKIMEIKYNKKNNDKNKNMFKVIKEKYPKGITLYIKRVYVSPNGKNKEIKTHISKPFKILIKDEDKIPEMIKIISFNADKKMNSKGKYIFNKANKFVPKCTYVYIEQFYHMSDEFKKIPVKNVNKREFVLNKNAKNIFKDNIEFINLNKIVKNLTYNYKMKYFTTLYYSKEKEKNKNNYTYNIPFNEIFKKL